MDLFDIRLADRKSRIAPLPREIGEFAIPFFQPKIGHAFQFFHPFGLRDRPAQPRQHVNVVLDATNNKGRTFKFSRNAPNVSMQRPQRGSVAQKGPPVLCRKHQVNVNSGERLRHSGRVVYRGASREPYWKFGGDVKTGHNRVAVDNGGIPYPG